MNRAAAIALSIAAVTSLALTGCASDFQNTPIPSNTPRTIQPPTPYVSGTVTVTPSFTGDPGYHPLDDGPRFVAMICSTESARDAFEADGDQFFKSGQGTLDNIKDRAKVWAITQTQMAAKLRMDPWPDTVKPAIEQLAANYEARAAIADALANAKNKKQAQVKWLARNTGGAEVVSAVDQIRSGLGLPPDDGACPI